ncbi:MAG: hypothetical protein ACOYB2_10980 [Limnohabitans sp.]
MAAYLMVAAYALDVGTFWLGSVVIGGVWADGNPVADALWNLFGVAGIVGLKVASATVIVVIARWRMRERTPRLAYLVAAWVGVVGAVSNLPGLAQAHVWVR